MYTEEFHALADSPADGGSALAYARGLEFIYKRPVIQLPDDVLKKFTGTYRNSFGDTIHIVEGKGNLILEGYDGWKDKMLFPLNDTVFSWEGNYNDIHFTYDAKNHVNGYHMYLYGTDFSAKKIQ